jgi:transposase
MIPTSVRIFVCTEPQDMRRGFDGLALVARQALGIDPQSGALVCFVNKRLTRLKILWWDRNGYCILYKRMHRAIVAMPTADGESTTLKIDGRQLAELLAGITRERRAKSA